MNKDEIFFYKGSKNILGNDKSMSDESKLEILRTKIAECFDVKNLSFLLGSGCSSLVVANKEVGIPTMKGLAKEYESAANDLLTKIGFTLEATRRVEILGNIERLLELLYSVQFCAISGAFNTGSPTKTEIDTHIVNTKIFLRDKCLNMADESLLVTLYQRFYRKLLCRDRQLSRVQVFTTNYDLLSEIAMDRSGIMYWNGFTGNIERRFNPASYKFVVSERLELKADHWSTIDNFILLYKLHGSLNWLRQNTQLGTEIREFPISQVKKEKASETIDEVMIYPTPGKVGATLSTPYSDLFREFQSRLSNREHILMTIGYSFGDEHINNLIIQALTLPSFRLIVFTNELENSNIKELIQRNDPRIWIIGGSIGTEKLHYFAGIVDKLLPDLPEGMQQKEEIIAFTEIEIPSPITPDTPEADDVEF